MAHLACVGSHAVNGVAALHTELLKHKVLRDFYELWPENSIIRLTVAPRRSCSNLKLAQLITQKIGNNWIKQPRSQAAGNIC